MNAFQIIDKDNNPIPINELDKQAAAFWDEELHPKQYASPKGKGNWFDTLGWHIAQQHSSHFYGRNTWNAVKLSMFIGLSYDIVEQTNPAAYTQAQINYLKPYYDLIDHWASLGYQPKQIKE